MKINFAVKKDLIWFKQTYHGQEWYRVVCFNPKTRKILDTTKDEYRGDTSVITYEILEDSYDTWLRDFSHAVQDRLRNDTFCSFRREIPEEFLTSARTKWNIK